MQNKKTLRQFVEVFSFGYIKVLYSHTKLMKTEKFVRGVSILLVSGVIAKILGAIFRIPLTWVLGIDGLGLYQLIYPVFALLIVLSSAGLPTAISKIVADRVSQQNYIGARQVLRLACIFFGLVSLVFSIALFFLAEQIASLQGNTLSFWGYRAIAPAVCVVSFLSCLRGYFQGMGNMVPTALSQILEQGGKLVFGLLLAWALLPSGVEFATSGALLGVTLSEILATTVIAIIYLKSRRKVSTGACLPTKKVILELISIAFPIVLSSIILPVLTFIDSFLVVNLLSHEFPVEVSTQLWGVSSGVVTSLINLPIALSLSVAVSVVPVLASSKENTAVLSYAFEMIFVFVVPIIIVFAVLGDSVIAALYGNSFVLLDKTQLATHLLAYSSPIVLLGCVLQTQTTSLQAVGLGRLALISFLVAGVSKVGLTILLVSIPDINIWGFTIANFVFYTVAVGLDALFLYKKLGFSGYFSQLKPVLAGSLFLLLVLLNLKLLSISPLSKIILGALIGGGGYLFAVTLFGYKISDVLLLNFFKFKLGKK